MNSEIIPKARRSRGRPRKTSSSLPNIAKSATPLKHSPSYTPKRKQLLDAPSDEIQVIGFNGFETSQAKKPKSEDLSDPNAAKRLLPHRAARFTESYGGTSPDVVIISDEEQGGDDSDSDSDSDCGPIPSPVIVVKSKEELEQYEENIQHLKQMLCDEEMKLVLLKKLQDSQKSKDLRRESNSSPLPTTGQPSSSSKSSSTVTLKSGVQIQPLPSKQLISNNKFLSSKKEMKFESTSHFNKAVPKASSVSSSVKHTVKAELNDSVASSVSSNSAEKINASHLQQYPLLKNLSAQITITAVPPVGSPAPTNHSQPATVSNSNKSTPAPVSKEDKGESLSHRQAAAKLALRKQLEKTLLQIPLPKPPPLKLNFFPNANSIEFLCLLGLDFVVDFLTKTKKSSVANPLTCAQCSTDFTCAWKWKEVDKNGVKSYDVFCEACINSNIRKSLKAQHTNSLKAAFLKALHQEKEIDKLTTMPSKSHSPTPRESSRTHLPSPSPAHQNSSMSVHSLPKHGAPVPYIPKVAPSLNHAAALAQMTKLSPQYQQLLQIQAQHLFATGVPLHPSMLSPFMSPSPNHHSRGKSSVPSDLRRQYRSDRVQSPSIPHSSSSWKA
ncbi:transcriptional repressor p66-alpha [Parasteatoda tepidariorum]|uniref:transcriptional repressor p66-alpha n=1 Tax=Parasteatoda tepidariorum TaxID=114398 RepID=UPI00077F84C8|nr:transcriptional repressor p66-alpha [Parasteatoda tepidariorum]XP_015920803.1 transcriptional repressor p66-alpha [Parasteatoda tepidariorum]XP_015920804.1 transcriptional repressor p66-alpha [Parasteatoda tepidariorum]XP_042895715.1 transcriptional repressor p66-alpha [Parasteatoda tepidariorum]